MRALLFSGGVDSTALAYALRPDLLLFVDYGQVAAPGERRASRSIAAELSIPLREIAADLSAFGSGTMTGRPPERAAATAPPEHWPFRNQALVTLAAMALADLRPRVLLIGTVAGDEEHDDGTAEFRRTLDRLLELQSGPRLDAPAAGASIEKFIVDHAVPEDLLRWTFSCHVAEWACGACRGCAKHDRIMRGLFERP